MITSTLDQLREYTFIGPNFKKAIEHILKTDFSQMEPGQYPIEGDSVFAIVNEYSTRPFSECDPESHRDYADIQIILSGEEKFGYAPLTGQAPGRPYDPEKDVVFYPLAAEDLCYIILRAGQFIIFFPADIHQPEVFVHQPALVKKVVVKVAL